MNRQSKILKLLYESGGTSWLGEISRRLDIPNTGKVADSIGKLEARGLVYRYEDPAGGKRIIALTNRGKRFAEGLSRQLELPMKVGPPDDF